MLRLPKNILEHPRLPEIEAYFTQSERLLWDRGSLKISELPHDPSLHEAILAASGIGHLVQGLELIEEILDRELKGLKAIQEKSAQPPAGRLSRLILLANDGSTRFYRSAETLLQRNSDRAWGCLVPWNAAEIGRAFTPRGGPAKALLIDNREALTLFLTVLASGPLTLKEPTAAP